MAPTVAMTPNLPVFRPSAQNLIGTVISAATGHAGRGLINLKPEVQRQHTYSNYDITMHHRSRTRSNYDITTHHRSRTRVLIMTSLCITEVVYSLVMLTFHTMPATRAIFMATRKVKAI